MIFIGRREELNVLQSLYNDEGFRLFLIYGRPGAGKTTLLEEVCKGKDSIFFTAGHESSRASLNKFSQKVLEHYDDKDTKPFSFWEHAFSYIRKKQDSKRIIIVLDEVENAPYSCHVSFWASIGAMMNTVYNGQNVQSINELKKQNNFLPGLASTIMT